MNVSGHRWTHSPPQKAVEFKRTRAVMGLMHFQASAAKPCNDHDLRKGKVMLSAV